MPLPAKLVLSHAQFLDVLRRSVIWHVQVIHSSPPVIRLLMGSLKPRHVAYSFYFEAIALLKGPDAYHRA